jgi:hypothetical protein
MPLDDTLDVGDPLHVESHESLHTLYNLWENTAPAQFAALAGAVFTGDVSGVTPTSPAHFTTKSFVEALVASGVNSWKQAVATATTANISLSGEQTLDGVLTSASRVLVKNQTAPAENGIYVSAAGAWSRATDMDTAGEATKGAAVLVLGGTTQLGSGWFVTSTVATLGVDPITWVQIIAAAGSIADGSVTNAKLATDAVTNAKVANDAINTAEIVAGAVTSAKLAAGAVDSTALADNAVTNAKMADNAVNTAEIAANAVTNAKILDATIVASTKLNATGTKNSSTVLHGDDVYRVPAGSGTVPFYNALDNGVSRDSGTDQSGNIQALINTVSSAGGGTIYFPEGVYSIKARQGNQGSNPPSDTSFYFTAFGVKSNITILGDGPGATIFRKMASDGPSYASTTLSGNVTVTGSALGSSTVGLADASAFPTEGYGLMVTGANRCSIKWTGKSGNNLTGCTWQVGPDGTYTSGSAFTWEARNSASNRLITNFRMASPSGTAYDRNIQLRGFTIDGNAANQATTGGQEGNGEQYGGIFFRSVENFVIENVEIMDWRGTASSGSDETFGCMLYNCLNGRIIASTAHGSTSTVSTSEGWQQQHSHSISYTGVVAYWCNKSQGFAIWKSDNTSYANCYSFLNNKRGFNQEDCEGTVYVNCIAGGKVPDTAANEGPFTALSFGTAGTSLGNGDYGFSCNTSKRSTYVNCVAQKNAQDGIVVHEDLAGFPSGLLKDILMVNCRWIENDQYGMEIRDIEAEAEITMIQCQVSDNATGQLQLVDSGINLNPPSGMTWRIIDWPGQWPRTSSGALTAKRWDREIIMTNASLVTLTLPPVATQNTPITIHSTGAGNVTLDGNASETINGATTKTLTAGKSVTLHPVTSSAWRSVGEALV